MGIWEYENMNDCVLQLDHALRVTTVRADFLHGSVLPVDRELARLAAVRELHRAFDCGGLGRVRAVQPDALAAYRPAATGLGHLELRALNRRHSGRIRRQSRRCQASVTGTRTVYG